MATVREVRNKKRKDQGLAPETDEEFKKATAPTPRTPEEEAQSKAEGNKFIREREKAVSADVQAGGSEAGARRRFMEQQRLVGDLAAQKLAEQEKSTERPTPEPLAAARNIPTQIGDLGSPKTGIIGKLENTARGQIEATGFGQAMISKSVLENADTEQLSRFTKKMKETGQTPEQISSDPFIQSLLKLGINDLDSQVLASGEVKVSLLTQTVEGIPFVGRLTKYTGAFNTPGKRVDTILSQISELENQLGDDAAFAKRNPLRANDYLKQVDNTEQEILRLESKIKLLSIQSPELQSNPEEIQKIQAKITRIKQRVLDSRIQIKGVIGI